jgi:hypothetical protein
MRAVIINNRYHVPLFTYVSQYVKHGITYNKVELFNDSEHFFVCDETVQYHNGQSLQSTVVIMRTTCFNIQELCTLPTWYL